MTLPDQKAELRKLRDQISDQLATSLAFLKPLGFKKSGRSWKRTNKDESPATVDIIDFELTVLKASVRVKMYESRWFPVRRKTALGTQTGRLEGTDDTPSWELKAAQEIPNLTTAVTTRVQQVTFPWFTTDADPSSGSSVF